MSYRHEKRINLLFNLAQDITPIASARIAAGVVYKGEIISFGVNSNKSDPLQKKYGINAFLHRKSTECDAIRAHAEVIAIKNAMKKISREELKKCSIYIARAKPSQENPEKFEMAMAKPCNKNNCGCEKLIKDSGIKKIYYTNKEKSFECMEI